PLRRQVDAAVAVEQRFSVDDDVAASRPANPGEGVDHAGLARAGTPEQADHRRFGAKCDRQLERAQRLLDVDVDHALRAGCARRVNHSDTTSAAMDRITAIRLRRSAWASAPGD